MLLHRAGLNAKLQLVFIYTPTPDMHLKFGAKPRAHSGGRRFQKFAPTLAKFHPHCRHIELRALSDNITAASILRTRSLTLSHPHTREDGALQPPRRVQRDRARH